MSKIRYVKPSSLQVGDYIRVSGTFKDTKVSVEGYIRHRLHLYSRSVTYETGDREELFTHHADNTLTRGEARMSSIALLKRNPDPTLF